MEYENERLNQNLSSVHAWIISSIPKNRLQIPFGRERDLCGLLVSIDVEHCLFVYHNQVKTL